MSFHACTQTFHLMSWRSANNAHVLCLLPLVLLKFLEYLFRTGMSFTLVCSCKMTQPSEVWSKVSKRWQKKNTSWQQWSSSNTISNSVFCFYFVCELYLLLLFSYCDCALFKKQEIWYYTCFIHLLLSAACLKFTLRSVKASLFAHKLHLLLYLLRFTVLRPFFTRLL